MLVKEPGVSTDAFVFQVGEEIVFFVEGKQLQSDPVVRIRGPTSTPQVR